MFLIRQSRNKKNVLNNGLTFYVANYELVQTLGGIYSNAWVNNTFD